MPPLRGKTVGYSGFPFALMLFKELRQVLYKPELCCAASQGYVYSRAEATNQAMGTWLEKSIFLPESLTVTPFGPSAVIRRTGRGRREKGSQGHSLLEKTFPMVPEVSTGSACACVCVCVCLESQGVTQHMHKQGSVKKVLTRAVFFSLPDFLHHSARFAWLNPLGNAERNKEKALKLCSHALE